MAAPSYGQERFEPHLGIALYAGATISARTAWSVPVQALLVPHSGGQAGPALFDTVSVGRTMGPGLSLGVGMTWHRTPRFAFGGAVEFLAKPSIQRCSGPGAWKSEPLSLLHPLDEHFNEQLCINANGSVQATGLLTLLLQARYAFTEGSLQPYAGVALGIGGPLNSYVETVGTVSSGDCPSLQPSCQVLLYTPEQTNLRPAIAPGLGMSVRVAPLATLVVEARDVMTWLPAARATPITEPLTRSRARFSHTVSLHAGLEFAFVARHERRY